MTTNRVLRQTTVHAARRGTRTMTPELLWSLPRVGAPLPLPGGAHVVVPVTTYDVEQDRGTARLWLVPTRGGIGRPLTAPERDAKEPAVSPDGRRLAFVTSTPAPRGEDPQPAQLAVMSLEGGEAEVLTEVPLGAFDPQWLPDGSGLVFGAWLFQGHLTLAASREEAARRKERPRTVHATDARFYRYWDRWLVDGRVPHLFLLDLASRDLKDLMPTSELHFDWMEPSGSYDIAPSGRELVLSGIAWAGPDARPRTDVYRLRVGQGVPECLTTHRPHESFGARFSPDGASIVYGWTEDPHFYADRVRLARRELRTDSEQDLLTRWDRSPGAWRFDAEGGLVFQAEDEGQVRIVRLAPDAPDAKTAVSYLTAGGTAVAPRPASDGRVYFLHHDLVRPPEAAWCDLEGGAVLRLTRFAEGLLDDVATGGVRSLVYEGAGGAPVQAYVVLPPQGADQEAGSLVHLVHGGPHGTFGDTWHWRWHAGTFAARGHVVACVNFQGSTSWGQDFAQRIQGAWGDRPAIDVLRATDVLEELGWVDGARVALAGGSYGGYLTAWLASTSDRFRCAVNHAGVYDLGLQYATDHNFSWGRASGGELWDGLERVDRYNPARHADGLNTPMLVVHGLRDYRVPADQALLCYGVLKAKGVPARLLFFDDENHWILKPRNSLRWYAEVLDWIDRHLKA